MAHDELDPLAGSNWLIYRLVVWCLLQRRVARCPDGAAFARDPVACAGKSCARGAACPSGPRPVACGEDTMIGRPSTGGWVKMRGTALLSIALVLLIASSVAAQHSVSAAISLSVTVVRSCSVTTPQSGTSTPSSPDGGVQVSCTRSTANSRIQPLVTTSSRPSSPSPSSTVSSSSGSLVTIQF
jgi:hypothetical protein